MRCGGWWGRKTVDVVNCGRGGRWWIWWNKMVVEEG